MHYTDEQIGTTFLRAVNRQSKNRQNLYVYQDNDIHIPVITGGTYGALRDKVAEMIAAGVRPYDIYSDVTPHEIECDENGPGEYGMHFGQAQNHLLLPEQR